MNNHSWVGTTCIYICVVGPVQRGNCNEHWQIWGFERCIHICIEFELAIDMSWCKLVIDCVSWLNFCMSLCYRLLYEYITCWWLLLFRLPFLVFCTANIFECILTLFLILSTMDILQIIRGKVWLMWVEDSFLELIFIYFIVIGFSRLNALICNIGNKAFLLCF